MWQEVLVSTLCILLSVLCGYLNGVRIAQKNETDQLRQIMMWMMMATEDGEEDE
jgi:hypothetical protein